MGFVNLADNADNQSLSGFTRYLAYGLLCQCKIIVSLDPLKLTF